MELTSTIRMLRAAYPGGLEESGFHAVVAILADDGGMSERNVAAVLAALTGREERQVVYLVRMSLGFDEPTEEQKEAVRRRLRPHGFDEWLNES